jgi:hypothetical protein
MLRGSVWFLSLSSFVKRGKGMGEMGEMGGMGEKDKDKEERERTLSRNISYDCLFSDVN